MISEFLVVGVFPPPSTGQSVAFKDFSDRFLGEYSLVDVSGGSGRFYKFKKMLKYISALRVIARNDDCIYYTLNSGFGLYLDFIFIRLCKLLRRRVIIHHHSYGYINSSSQIVRSISSALNQDDYFIFLSPEMKHDYEAVYHHDAKTLCLNNIFQYDLSEKKRSEAERAVAPVRIGYLSNLTLDKGFDTICEIVNEIASSTNLEVEFHIAGPFSDNASRNLYDQLSPEERSLVRYYGPVYGSDKEEFFTNIDLFLFPTRYANEAQPMVLVEALQYGLPVLATGRGTIADLLGEEFPVSSEELFLQRAIDYIKLLSQSQSIRNEHSAKAIDRFRQLKAQSLKEVEDIRRVIGEITSDIS